MYKEKQFNPTRRAFLGKVSALAAASMAGPVLGKVSASPLSIPDGAFAHRETDIEGLYSLLSVQNPYVGVESAPYGAYTATNRAFLGWEWWPGTAGTGGPSGQFSNQAPDNVQTGGTVNSALLSQTNAAIGTSPSTPSGAPSYARGGRLTSGGEDGGYQFTLTANTNFAVSRILLQVKHSNFLVSIPTSPYYVGLGYVNNPPTNLSSSAIVPFEAKLNAGSYVTGSAYHNPSNLTISNSFARGSWDPSDGSTTGAGNGGTTTFFFTFQFEWSFKSAIPANTNFTINLRSLEDTILEGFSVDTVTLDVAGPLTLAPGPIRLDPVR